MTEEGERNHGADRIAQLESIVADNTQGVVHRNKSKIELAQLRDVARLAAENAILERQVQLQATAAQRRADSAQLREEAVKRAREADAKVSGAEKVAEAAILAAKRAVEELQSLKEVAGSEQQHAQTAEQKFEEFSRLERKIERESEDFAGAAASNVAQLESIVANNIQGVVHCNKSKIELAHLRDDARLAAENAILERQVQLQAAAAQRRADSAQLREEAVKRACEADAKVSGAEKVTEAAISAAKRAVEELHSLREVAGRERQHAQTAEQKFEEFSRLERKIERELKDFAGAAARNGDEAGKCLDESEQYANGESHDISAVQGEDNHGEAAVAINAMEAEMRQLSQEGHWKHEAENLSYRCDELLTALGECEERAEAAENENAKRQAVLEDYMRLLERKEKELAKCKRMMKVAYEAEEAAQQAANEAKLAAKEAAERATMEAEVRAASEAAELQAAKEAARLAEERAEAAENENAKQQAVLEDCMQVLGRKEKELAKCKRMMKIAYEAEEMAQRVAKEAKLAAKEVAERATMEAEARAASEAAELQAAKEAARLAEERTEAAENENAKQQSVLEDCMQVLERKENELAKCKRMMKMAYEAEETAQRAAKEAKLAAKEAAERATTEAEAGAASEAAELLAAKEAARLVEEQVRLEEEASERSRRAEEEAARAALEEAKRTRLVVLISEGTADFGQRSDVGNTLRLLNDFRIPHEVIDGTEASKGRETLFAISRIKGHFPQLFSVKGDAGIDTATFLGGYRWLNRRDARELRDMFPLPPGGWTSSAVQTKDLEIARLKRLIEEERELAARERKKLEDEVEDLEDSLIQASELLDKEKARSQELKAEAKQPSLHGQL